MQARQFAPGPRFDELARERLLVVALETMHVGHLHDRGLMPAVVIAMRDVDAVDQVAIAEWMGASPVYTRRMRRLMGIEGDGVSAIMKALQLDVGFVHQYMDVGWRLVDERQGEFWLNHCGALMDVEPHGEKRVVGMCHTIEDPTFDATAYATNPRARVRPIHRPPRVPADRRPHCHWRIEIDPANDPVGPAQHMEAIAALPLAHLRNERAPARGGDAGGLTDYRGAFVPDLKLGDFSTHTLEAVAREFQIQSHLLSSSAELTLAGQLGLERAREVLRSQWLAVAWVAGQRLCQALGPTRGGAAAVAEALRLHAALPPGYARTTQVEGDRVTLVLEPSSPGLLDREQPGWLGLCLRDGGRGVEVMAQAADPRARLVRFEVSGGRLLAEVDVAAGAAPAEAPPEAAFMHLSTATAWRFDTSPDRLGS